MNLLSCIIQLIMIMLFGAIDIYFMIYNFQKKRYFIFGGWTMATVVNLVQLIHLYFVVLAP